MNDEQWLRFKKLAEDPSPDAMRTAVRTVTCPKCRASENANCTESGKLFGSIGLTEIEDVHKERIEAWLASFS